MSEHKGGRPDRKQFRRVKEAKGEGEDKPKSAENHVRVVASRGQRMYIKYAIDVFNGADGKTKSDSVILTGMGNAVYNVVNVTEILKRRVKGLHQTTEIASETMTDKYEAVEEGKPGLEVERKVSTIKIVLSTAALDKNHPGYQAPLPESEVVEEDPEALKKERRPRKKAAKKDDKKKGGDDKKKGDAKKDGEKKGDKKKGDAKPAKKDDKKGGKKDEKKGDAKKGGRGGDKKDDRAPTRGGRGGRGGRREERDDRAPARGGRGGRASGGRSENRDDRAPARGRGGRDGAAPRGGRAERGGRRN